MRGEYVVHLHSLHARAPAIFYLRAKQEIKAVGLKSSEQALFNFHIVLTVKWAEVF